MLILYARKEMTNIKCIFQNDIEETVKLIIFMTSVK